MLPKTIMVLNPRKKKRGGGRSRRRSTRINFNPKRAHKRSSGRRRGGGRSSRRGGMSLSGIAGGVKEAFGKPIIMTGLGLFAANVVYNIVWGKYGLTTSVVRDPNTGAVQYVPTSTTDPTPKLDSKGNKMLLTVTTGTGSLPLSSNTMGPTLYAVAIPVAIGLLLRKFNGDLAKGAFLGTINALINTYLAPTVDTEIKQLMTPSTSGASAYFGRMYGPSAYLPGNRGRNLLTNSVGNFPGQKPLFAQSSWDRR